MKTHLWNSKGRLVVLLAVSVISLGLLLAACVPGDVSQGIVQSRADIAAIKADLAAMKSTVAAIEEARAIDYVIRDQVVKGRADLLEQSGTFSSMGRAAGLITGSSARAATADTPARAAVPGVVDLVKSIEQGRAFDYVIRDQIVRARADLLELNPTFTATKEAVAGAPAVRDEAGKEIVAAKRPTVAQARDLTAVSVALLGVPAVPAVAAKPAVPATDTTPAVPAVVAKPAVPAVPAVVAQQKDLEALAKQVADLKAQLDRIEKAVVK